MLSFSKHSERKKAEDFAKKVLRCARRIDRLIREWEETVVDMEKIEREKGEMEKIFPLLGVSKCTDFLREIQSLSKKASEFKNKMLERANPFSRLGE